MKCERCKDIEIEPLAFKSKDIPENFVVRICYNCRNRIIPSYLYVSVERDQAIVNYLKYIRIWQNKYLKGV